MSDLLQPTQRDIARKAQVTQATVSMALSNHPSISPETRERIQQISRELNYCPDPYLAGLCAYRRRTSTSRTYKATLAWLSNWHAPSTSRWLGVNSGYFDGALARAHELGYSIEEHALLSPGMTPSRMERILYARNIQGLLLPPQPRSGLTLDFCFDRFSVVTFGYTLEAPQFHTVTLHHYRAMETLFRKLLSLGYKRPGLALSIQEDMRTDRIWSAAFWSEQRRLPQAGCIPFLMGQTLNQKQFMQWFRRYRPDVVIASNKEVHEWLMNAEVAVPEHTGFALLGLESGERRFSGICQNPQLTGAQAVVYLIDMLHRGERGIPKVRSHLLVDATWVEGDTVRKRDENTSSANEKRTPRAKGQKVIG